MTCTEFELLLCDYTDGTLASPQRADVELHLQSCKECAALARDAVFVREFIERVPDVTPPPALVTRILQQTPKKSAISLPSRGFLGRLFQPVLQPRMVMGMAMTILSFAMLGRFAGIEIRQLRPSDLDPVKVWEATEDRVHRSWTRAVKYYESLRIVLEVQSRLRDLTDNEADPPSEQQQEKK
ncbi:MAG: zf-HC2 domain-containing protein [Candidatus Solibacter usitatus]|nr:zf-HC2 domain-containing protein [Candidatus Solibacter usitatus]